MSKRILSLLLCLVMFGACLVGCNKDKDAIEDTAIKASEKTETIVMHLMSEEEVSDDQAAEIQNAVNKITKSKFKTQLILRFYTPDEYYAALEQAYDDRADAAANNKNNSNAAKDETGSETAEETFVDEYGVVQLKYPTVADYQVDIFYLGGYEKLMEYIDNDMVADLTDDVASASKKLKTYMTPGYLEGMDAVCGGIYAIPANAPVGEYTYMLLNKEAIKKYNHVASDFDSLLGTKTAQFLEVIATYEKDNYVPIRSFTESGELDITNYGYFGVDENGNLDTSTFSLVGGTYDSSWKYGKQNQYIPAGYIFYDDYFIKNARTLVEYKQKGYYGTTADANKDFAVGYIKGGIELIEEYSDKYEVVVLEKPKVNTMDVFENMFAVSKYTSNLERSMEIITYLYTNSDFRNLLLYGIEGTNYELVESEMMNADNEPYMVVKRLNNNYMMAPEKTGNVLLAIPTVDQAPNLRELYKQQNLDSSLSLTLGFTTAYNGLELSKDHYDHLRTQSAKVLGELLEIKTVTKFDTYVSTKKLSLNTDKLLGAAVSSNKIADPADPDATPLETIASLYAEWLMDNKIIPRSE